MRQVPGWNEYFMDIARAYAKRSKNPEPHRQVGCVIVDWGFKTIKSGGYNGMVASVPEDDTKWERPLKDRYVCHAEFNAIAIAARNGIATCGCIIYTTAAPCLTCSRLLIQAGIWKVLYPAGAVTSSFGHEYSESMMLLTEAKIEVVTL